MKHVFLYIYLHDCIVKIMILRGEMIVRGKYIYVSAHSVLYLVS
jgi:hypothetical protein